MPAKMKITFEFGKRQVAENLPKRQLIGVTGKMPDMFWLS
jgi:hypothetical protein